MSFQITDMMGRTFELKSAPQRIISVVPSQTELLYDLGLDEEVIGITKFCIHPSAWQKNKTKIGGTKNLNIALIKSLNPDLIIANKEENTKSEIEELSKHFPVWISDICTLHDALAMISKIGAIIGKKTTASLIIDDIANGFEQLTKNNKPKSIAYLIWQNPWMCVGSNTFIHEMINSLGWHNVYGLETRYPETSIEELKSKKADLILLSSEPYPFKEQHVAALQRQIPNAKIILVDGEYFSWYGSRLTLSYSYFAQLAKTYC
ncbi:MAG: ABC transporter substrate-binding protein [Chitinophagaceae bacterium]|nr:ABC transporter substrate-binding protein [Chitinophagaceae bacterium]